MFLDKLLNKFKKKESITLSSSLKETGLLDNIKVDKPEIITLKQAIKRFKPEFEPKERVISDDEVRKLLLYAVVLGDISGSRYEGIGIPDYESAETIDLFTKYHDFTDDTVLSIAVLKATQKLKKENIINENIARNIYGEYLKEYTKLYPNHNYGGRFYWWAFDEHTTNEGYYSCGNGSCMRVTGIAALFNNIEDIISYAYYSSLPTHDHPEGIKGACCTAVIYWMLINGASKDDIKEYFKKQYPVDNGYKINSNTTLHDLINMEDTWASLTVISQTSLPEAIINFLESDSFENCLRNSYKYLCDRDTISAIAAPMAAIYYRDISINGMPGDEIVEKYLDDKLFKDINS